MLMPSFHLSFPNAKAVRSALAAGAVAGLVVIAACTDGGTASKALTAPPGPRTETTSTNTLGHGAVGGLAGTILVCIDASAVPGPVGTYTLSNSLWNDNHPIGGGPVDPGDGGEGWAPENGTTVWTPAKFDANPYSVIPGPGNCKLIVDRQQPSVHYNGVSFGYGPDHLDDFQSVRISVAGIPANAAYDHTDCVGDIGVPDPQPTPCGTGNQTTKAFANYDHGTKVTFVFKSAPTISACDIEYSSTNPLGYPNHSGPFINAGNGLGLVQRSMVAFNESEVLSAFAYDAGTGELRMWYTDEHALTLGVSSVLNKIPNPDVTTPYTVEPFTPAAGFLSDASGANPPIGTTALTGTQRGTDAFDRPIWPSLFVTDLNTAISPTAGDWQYGGTSIPPYKVYGTWKGVQAQINTNGTRQINGVSDPTKNHNNSLASVGGVNPPAGTLDNGYAAEVVWRLADLGLAHGSAYRFQFMVHDGDQNKGGGDVGEACVNLIYP